jgi:AraC-like DNA-binding protein
MKAFIESLIPFYHGEGKINDNVALPKRTELLKLILSLHPAYSAILFDFGKPGKIDLEAFMNQHYKFNVKLERLAYMTGRSISAFKRDFAHIFHNTPARWLTSRRLREAHFLIVRDRAKPAEFYLDLGFEDLSHFSFAFKKKFGLSATDLALTKHEGC